MNEPVSQSPNPPRRPVKEPLAVNTFPLEQAAKRALQMKGVEIAGWDLYSRQLLQVAAEEGMQFRGRPSLTDDDLWLDQIVTDLLSWSPEAVHDYLTIDPASPEDPPNEGPEDLMEWSASAITGYLVQMLRFGWAARKTY